MYSLTRQERANQFIDSVFPLSNASSLKPPKLCIGIASVARPGEQYIRSTVGSLLEGLDGQQRKEIHLTILIAHTESRDHPIHGEEWLKAVANKVLLYGVSEEQFKQLQTWEMEKDYEKKAIFDYTYLLDNCLATGASWIAMIEDDTLAMAGWYPKAMNAVDAADAQHQRGEAADWLYLRLFYTEGFFGWNAEEWPQYLLTSMTIVATLAVCLFSIRSFRPQILISNHAIIAICFFYTPACIALYFLAGRLSMRPLTPGIHQMSRFGCCAQAFVFSREMAPKVVKRLTTKKTGFVDMLLEEWADEEELVRWAVVPSLLQHIGGRSSKGDDWGGQAKYERSVAEKIWSFGFELASGDGS